MGRAGSTQRHRSASLAFGAQDAPGRFRLVVEADAVAFGEPGRKYVLQVGAETSAIGSGRSSWRR